MLVYGQFPVRRGIAKGGPARLVGIAFILLGGIELFIPKEHWMVFLLLELACVGIFYFMLDGEPPKKK